MSISALNNKNDMQSKQQQFAVMFADVVGSTRMYERLGDNSASQLIVGALIRITEIINQHRGITVKTIGDEIMCRFDTADDAIECACDIQKSMKQLPAHKGMMINFRIGVHWGSALLQSDGDIFGDAVNLAARMAGIAKSRQIITTEMTLAALTRAALVSMCREVDRLKVKGKSEPLSIVEVVWEPNEVTHMSTFNMDNLEHADDTPLTIIYQNNQHLIEASAAAYTFGREAHCDQVILSSRVSRVHAKIENRRGKFILIDESTNGTYLQIDNMRPLFLRREEITLHGQGVISFGEEPGNDNAFVVYYRF